MLKWIDEPEEVTTTSQGLGPAPEESLITALTGFVHGTMVYTQDGWTPVERVCVGETLLTFDNGMQTVVDIQRERSGGHWTASSRPVFVPQGVLENDEELWLMPDQGVLWETPEDIAADPFVVLPAQSLARFRGMSRRLPDDFHGVTILTFKKDEIVQVQGGAWLHCPHPRPVFDFDAHGPDPYRCLSVADARAVLERSVH